MDSHDNKHSSDEDGDLEEEAHVEDEDPIETEARLKGEWSRLRTKNKHEDDN
jgi:hypothetical protein